VVLTITVGAAVFTSNRNQGKRSSALGLSVAIFGSALWVLFVQLFRSATDADLAAVYHQTFAAVSLFAPLGCLLYAASLLKHKALAAGVSIVSALATVVIGCLLLFNVGAFYTDIVIQQGGNYAVLANSPLTMV
jgi:hypothetical protein